MKSFAIKFFSHGNKKKEENIESVKKIDQWQSSARDFFLFLRDKQKVAKKIFAIK